MSASTKRQVFVDTGITDKQEFLRAFLHSGALNGRARSALAKRGYKSGDREEQVEGILEALEDGDITHQDIVRVSVAQSMGYLAIRTGSCDRVKLQNAAALATSFGSGWYGPLDGSSDTESLYVYVKKVTDWYVVAEEDGTPEHARRYIRWIVTARITDTHATFHWDGFTRAATKDRVHLPESYSYWERIDGIIDELSNRLNAKWKKPNLAKLVYERLWKRYGMKPEAYNWKHLGVNAERDGVSLNASSAKSKKVDGLLALASALTDLIIGAVDMTLKSKRDEIEYVLLMGIIKEWGTKSYTFVLDSRKGNRLFHGRFYLGNYHTKASAALAGNGDAERSGAESLAHIRCLSPEKYGGSVPTARWLLKHVRG